MTQDQWLRVAAAFEEAVEMNSESQSAFLTALHAEEPDVWQEVKKLLEEESRLHPLFQTQNHGPWLVQEDVSLVGTSIGPYRLVSHLGAGGMGSVFEARRLEQDFEQKVALKLIRPDALSPETMARFRKERQILAGLQHPHIAQLYDGGQTEEGRLFFTMELISGKNLIEYSRESSRTLSEKIHLFLQVAEAIAYAHARLVLHLDIKPGNILVDETGAVKMLDFGVAEQLGGESLPSGNYPESTHRYTLAYASPEQLRKQPLNTRSDIYSLGVLLYELLTDSLPFATGKKSREDYRREVLSATISPPSVVNNEVPADLGAVCMRALEKNPDDRYPSVDVLIQDLKAWLAGRSVSIWENKTGYRAAKYIRRNRVWLSLAAVLAILAPTVTGYYTLRLQQERNQAREEAEKSEQLLKFVTDIFEKADPMYAQGDTLTVYDLLEQATQRVATQLGDKPELYITMLHTLGSIYLGQGEYGRADTLCQQAYAVLADNPVLSGGKTEGNVYFLQADIHYAFGDYASAEKAMRTAMRIFQSETDESSQVCHCYLFLGRTAFEQSDFNRGDSLLRQGLACFSAQEKPLPEDLAQCDLGLGDVNRKMMRFDEAAGYYAEALHFYEKIYQPPNSELAYVYNHLASLYFDQGLYEKALPAARESYHQRLEIFGADHVETCASLSNIARIQASLGHSDSALVLNDTVLLRLGRIFKGPHPYLVALLGQKGIRLNELHRYKEAEAVFRQGLDMYHTLSQNNESSHLSGGVMHTQGLGIAMMGQKRYPAALQQLQTAEEMALQLYEKDSPLYASLEAWLAKALIQNGKKDEGLMRARHAKTVLTPFEAGFRPQLARIDSLLAGQDN